MSYLDTNADTKRYDFDASLANLATEMIANTVISCRRESSLTPVTGVRIPLGSPNQHQAV